MGDEKRIYSFALPIFLALSLSSKYSLTLPLATCTTSASSTVGGTFTLASKSPFTPFSTNSRSTRRRVFPLRVLGIMFRPWMMPPREAMAPICSRTRVLIDVKSSGVGVAGIGAGLNPGVVRGWMNAKGRWPLRGSGMPTTLASPTSGWERMACSIAPVVCQFCSERIGSYRDRNVKTYPY